MKPRFGTRKRVIEPASHHSCHGFPPFSPRLRWLLDVHATRVIHTITVVGGMNAESETVKA